MPCGGVFHSGFVIGENTFVTGQSCGSTLAVLCVIWNSLNTQEGMMMLANRNDDKPREYVVCQIFHN